MVYKIHIFCQIYYDLLYNSLLLIFLFFLQEATKSNSITFLRNENVNPHVIIIIANSILPRMFCNYFRKY